MNWIAIAIGGLLGVMSRALLASYLPSLNGVSVAIFIVNVVGCGLAGAVTAYGEGHQLPSWLILGIGVGFLGGLTTFSGLLLDAFTLIKNGSSWFALFYVSANLIVGFGMLIGCYKWTNS
jgi:CrcB protein